MSDEQTRLEAPLGHGRYLTVDINTPRKNTLWLQVWHSCGKCIEAEWAIDLGRNGRAERIGGNR